jgi:hypothetical protein
MLILSGLANAQSQATRPELEAASIKPNTSGARGIMIRPVGGRLAATNVTLRMLTRYAYKVPSIFTAVQDQLGLKPESQKAPAEILVIDHAEKPSEN